MKSNEKVKRSVTTVNSILFDPVNNTQHTVRIQYNAVWLNVEEGDAKTSQSLQIQHKQRLLQVHWDICTIVILTTNNSMILKKDVLKG